MSGWDALDAAVQYDKGQNDPQREWYEWESRSRWICACADLERRLASAETTMKKATGLASAAKFVRDAIIDWRDEEKITEDEADACLQALDWPTPDTQRS